MASVKFLLNTNKLNAENKYPIVIQVIHQRKKKIAFLGYSLNSNEWDYNKEEPIVKSKIIEHRRFLQQLHSLVIKKKAQYLEAIIKLEELGKPFTVEQIFESLNKKYCNITIFNYAQQTIAHLKKSGKIGNSKAYDNTYASFKKFLNNKDISFDNLDYRLIKKYDEYLQCNKVSVNTISYYMRTLRALYNRAIKEGVAKSELYPFKTYKIKREKTVKRAIVKSTIASIKNFDVTNRPDLEKARDFFMFSFYCRGMSFVDVAHLKVSNIIDGRINYARNKTNQKFTIKITPQIQEIIDKYSDLKNKESYIFPIIIDPQGDIYTQYRNAMRLTNKKLKKIGKEIGLEIPLTTYVSRHSWATIAKREGIPTAVISEGLGHESEKTTQIYLDSFENNVLDDANNIVTSF